MIIQSIRRITNDARHNAFTGACWFKDHLFVAYRQGDAHCDPFGRIVVLRSRDKGLSWDHVAVVRGPGNMQDVHLYSDGRRLYAVGSCFRQDKRQTRQSGCAITADGDRWTSWAAYEGTGRFILWRPQFHRGKHYCAAYTWRSKPPWGAVWWFESRDGWRWRQRHEIHAGDERPSECDLEIRPDGKATMLMRCDGGVFQPYLCISAAPFREWRKRKLEEITLVGPCVWTVGDDIYIGGRWNFNTKTGDSFLARDEGAKNKAHTAIFKMIGEKPILQAILPSGPRLDHSYMGVARYPNNPRRLAISFYSDAIAPSVGGVDQWTHPDIYLADVRCER